MEKRERGEERAERRGSERRIFDSRQRIRLQFPEYTRWKRRRHLERVAGVEVDVDCREKKGVSEIP